MRDDARSGNETWTPEKNNHRKRVTPHTGASAHTYYNVEKLGRTQCTQTTLDRHTFTFTQATRTAHNGSLAVVPGRGTTCLPYISYVFTRHSHARRAGRPRPQSSHGRSILSQVSGRKPAPHIAILLSRGTSGQPTSMGSMRRATRAVASCAPCHCTPTQSPLTSEADRSPS